MEGFSMLLLCLSLVNNVAVSIARDTIDRVQFLSDNGETIVSADETFALGFFSPGTSKNRYVGIWYNKVPKQSIVWVANRNKPLTNLSGVLKVIDNGILVLLDRNNNNVNIWSSNTTSSATQDPIAKLLNSGNLVVRERSKGDDDNKNFLWQSFDYPSDTMLPGQKLGRNLVTGLNRYLRSWNNSNDPSYGRYSLQLDIDGCPQLMIRDGATKSVRIGSWNGVQFSGQAAVAKKTSIVKYNYVSNEEEEYATYELINSVAPHKLVLETDGICRRATWSNEESSWITISKSLEILATTTQRVGLILVVIAIVTLCAIAWMDLYQVTSKIPYAALDISKGENGCLLWFGNLNDMEELTPSLQNIYIRMAATELGTVSGHHNEEIELPLFDMSTIISATNNFSADNILGKGGSGSVYKGILKDGQEIAVKKLSRNSSRRLQEFKNEAMHIAKLQHRNLVKLLGFCIQEEERLLVYEFMRNKSLDFFIFDCERGKLLDWRKRFFIINGIVKGLLYLHHDSRHRIIHRDLKAGNILLDDELNPKISDFGLARSFVGNENEDNTSHIAGTYGYLSPEYIIDGLYSTKSDVYSFGVLVLEIVSGKRNRGFTHVDHHLNLLGHAWTLFAEGKCLEMVDVMIKDSIDSPEEVIRLIHVGLLCVQRRPEDRPSMSDVLMMLSSEGPLPQPKKPGFFIERDVDFGDSSSSRNDKLLSSVNHLTVSDVNPR
ncbi:G-type lectin S-receptor-like serine/threonine-protein kinase At4g27290 [Arachis duranensis]|uniref:Receptor-like serine/threonine-protein kinase n=1 Tax=Arachis duranensis TaxID=130453 RepID=A0A6P5MLC9_ARADU|nr:G-type lectin S-receptor-like serine/threonine-protein kinase At4g27290 [Arachis duranensis]